MVEGSQFTHHVTRVGLTRLHLVGFGLHHGGHGVFNPRREGGWTPAGTRRFRFIGPLGSPRSVPAPLRPCAANRIAPDGIAPRVCATVDLRSRPGTRCLHFHWYPISAVLPLPRRRLTKPKAGSLPDA